MPAKVSQGDAHGPPPLKPFGLVLHHDGRWAHEGLPLKNRKLREAFDRSVRYLAEEGKYVVQLAHFRGQIELEEAGFFVRDFDSESGEIALSDRSREPLEVNSLGGGDYDFTADKRLRFANWVDVDHPTDSWTAEMNLAASVGLKAMKTASAESVCCDPPPFETCLQAPGAPVLLTD